MFQDIFIFLCEYLWEKRMMERIISFGKCLIQSISFTSEPTTMVKRVVKERGPNRK